MKDPLHPGTIDMFEGYESPRPENGFGLCKRYFKTPHGKTQFCQDWKPIEGKPVNHSKEKINAASLEIAKLINEAEWPRMKYKVEEVLGRYFGEGN